jgi:ribosomal-protein-alanine N-acetyltransferase
LNRGGHWLERATDDDVDSLAALEAACHSHPWTVDQIRQEVAYGFPGAVLVLRGCRPPGAIRAFCVYRVVADEMHVLDVAVDPDARREGLARWLLGLSLRLASRTGARRALLEVRESNEGARSLYESLGFCQVGRRRDYYAHPREDAFVLGLEPLPDADS